MDDLARLGDRVMRDGVRRTRRSWTTAQKLAIVDEAKGSGDPVSLVARRHGMNANHLFNWMQRERDGTLDRGGLYARPGGPMDFVDLGVVGSAAAGAGAGLIEIELPNRVRVRVAAAIEGEALRRVLAAVKAAL
jgi:transposase-like protein